MFIYQPQAHLFLEEFLLALQQNKSAILINHQWQNHELNQVKQLFNLSSNQPLINSETTLKNFNFPVYLIPTGGTSGNIKFAIHTRETLCASVRGFQEFFGIEKVNCFCILPLYHVSGLMQFWRSHLTSGILQIGDYDALKRGILPDLDVSDFCISLVPTQLQVLLKVCPQWLAQFRLVLLGGAAPWRSLLEQARKYQIRLALTYGMTETASQVVALKPEDFLAGKSCAGQVLPHAKLHFSATGVISIEAKSLFLGYYPDATTPKRLQTDDVGNIDADGYVHLLGRQSQKIISGGENIYPAEVEAVIFATNLVADVAVLGVPDPYWGEAVAAIIILKRGVDLDAVKRAIADQLSRYKQPKHWRVVAQLPRNVQGKLNRIKLQAMIEKDYQ